jgi:hypothetical protein
MSMAAGGDGDVSLMLAIVIGARAPVCPRAPVAAAAAAVGRRAKLYWAA